MNIKLCIKIFFLANPLKVTLSLYPEGCQFHMYFIPAMGLVSKWVHSGFLLPLTDHRMVDPGASVKRQTHYGGVWSLVLYSLNNAKWFGKTSNPQFPRGLLTQYHASYTHVWSHSSTLSCPIMLPNCMLCSNFFSPFLLKTNIKVLSHDPYDLQN